MNETEQENEQPLVMPGVWENGEYTEIIGKYRILIWETADPFEVGYVRWEVQTEDSELGWYKVEGSPKRRMMITERAYAQALESIRLLQKYDAGH